MERIRKVERNIVALSLVLPLMFTIALVVKAWPNWWALINFEKTPMTWFQSLVLYTCSLTAFACAAVTFIQGEKLKNLKWMVLGLVFMALSLDERFFIHERIRDNILAPNKISIPLLGWTAPGDFLLIVLLIIGLAAFPWILKSFKERRSAYYCFISAVIIAGIAVCLDSLDFTQMSDKFSTWEQFVEEILELSGMLLFFNSFFLILSHRLRQFIQR